MTPQEENRMYVKIVQPYGTDGHKLMLYINDGVETREKFLQGYRHQIDASEACSIARKVISEVQNVLTEIASDYVSVKEELAKIRMEEARFYNKLFAKDRYEE